MILLIDNYDSFTYNLYQYMGELGATFNVFRNDKITIKEIGKMNPEKIVISPGPCTPKEAGISKNVVEEFGSEIPILGVCLGHQCIGEVYGGDVVRARRIMHGKISPINHTGKYILEGLPNPFEATRYHSLIVKKETLPDCFEILAWADEDEIMALKHKEFPVFGVQFHPESIETKVGKQILKKFLEIK